MDNLRATQPPLLFLVLVCLACLRNLAQSQANQGEHDLCKDRLLGIVQIDVCKSLVAIGYWRGTAHVCLTKLISERFAMVYRCKKKDGGVKAHETGWHIVSFFFLSWAERTGCWILEILNVTQMPKGSVTVSSKKGINCTSDLKLLMKFAGHLEKN